MTLAVLNQVRIALEDGFGEQLAARNLDPEFAFETEDDVQEIDGLGAQISLQRGRRFNVFLIHVQRLDQRRGHLGINFVLRRHRSKPPT